MAQITFSLTQRNPQTGQVLTSHTKAELSSQDLAALLKELRANGAT